MTELTVGESIDQLHKVFVTCSGCGRMNQLSYGELRSFSERTWRGVFSSMRCRQAKGCGARAGKLEVFAGPQSARRLVLELVR